MDEDKKKEQTAGGEAAPQPESGEGEEKKEGNDQPSQ